MASPPLLTLPDTVPSWIAGKPARDILNLIQTACIQAGVTGPAKLLLPVDCDGLTHRMSAHSLILRPSGRSNSPTSLALMACGKDAKNLRVHATLILPAEQRPLFETFVTTTHNGVFKLYAFLNPVLRSATVPVAPAPGIVVPALAGSGSPSFSQSVPVSGSPQTFDDETLALFLADIREVGGRVTSTTAEVIARRSTGSDQIIHECRFQGHLIQDENYQFNLSQKALALIDRILTPSAEGTLRSSESEGRAESPSEFTRLKTAVLTARQHLASIEAEHHKHATARALLQKELTAARASLKDSEKAIQQLQERLQKLQQHTLPQERARVLQLESEHRNLPDEAALHTAQRTLESAELAYNDLIKL